MLNAMRFAGLVALGLLSGCADVQKRPVVYELPKPSDSGQPADWHGHNAQAAGIPQNTKQINEARPSIVDEMRMPIDESRSTMARQKQLDIHNSKAENAATPLNADAVAEERIVSLIPGHVADRAGWARDIVKVFAELGLHSSPANTCSVLAIIQQESGFQANPSVSGMHRIILDELERKYGKYGKQIVKEMLDVKPAGEKDTYWNRLLAAKTEYDVDRIFREYIVYQEVKHPGLMSVAAFTGKMFGIEGDDQINPITTVGSMQVSVRFSMEQAKFNGMSAWQVREFLYTRYGGIYFGTLRLLGYPASYANLAYRFADYNLGVYASRNAAVQQQLSVLVGYKLALDGDLLRYTKNGAVDSDDSETEKAIWAFAKRYAPTLDKKTIHNDLRAEKSARFETTKTYLAIKQVYTALYGAPSYAIVPAVGIQGPKIKSKKFTTAAFANAVTSKYQHCIKKLKS